MGGTGGSRVRNRWGEQRDMGWNWGSWGVPGGIGGGGGGILGSHPGVHFGAAVVDLGVVFGSYGDGGLWGGGL